MKFKTNILLLVALVSLNFIYCNLSMTFNTLDDSDIINKQNKILKPIFSSMILPGLGQYQKGEKLKALIFFGIEVSALYALNYYNKRGDKIVDDYQEFSNQNWSFENWILDYDCWNVAYQGINNDCNYEYSDVFSNISYDQNGNQFENYLSIWEHSHHIDFYFNNGLISTNDQIFQDLYYEFINWIEEDNDGKSFVEYYDIEVKKDHHFYEGIRKYNMFFAGWEDAKDNIQRVVQPSGYIIATSPKKNYYNKRWNQSIDMYDYAEFAITSIYLNHVISVLDIYFKSKFDNRLRLELSNKYLPNQKNGNYILNFKINLK